MPSAPVPFTRRFKGMKVKKQRLMRVTLVSGFLGSGKTSLLQHILTNKDHNMKCAVIVNEISEFNIDAMAVEGSALLQSDEKMVEMSNGCICCTLREDLLEQLHELHEQGYDAALVESSGISEPMQVAETFFYEHDDLQNPDAGLQVLQKITPLDNCVTVVDAANLMQHMQSLDTLGSIDKKAQEQEDQRNIAALMFDQLEFANVVLLNKVDVLEQSAALHAADKKDEDAVTVESLTSLIKKINPHCEVIPTKHSQVPLSKIINTGNFTLAASQKKSGWMDTCKDGIRPETTETEEYGVSAMTFTPKVPFHPQRLYDWMTKYFHMVEETGAAKEGGSCALNQPPKHDHDEEEKAAPKKPELSEAEKKAEEEKRAAWAQDIKQREERRAARYGNLFRGKGFAWIGSPKREHLFALWGQAGNTLTFGGSSDWSNFPNPGPGGPAKAQRLVFIGQDLKKDAITQDLEACLLNEDELDKFLAAMDIELDEDNGQQNMDRPDIFPDPFQPFELPPKSSEGGCGDAECNECEMPEPVADCDLPMDVPAVGEKRARDDDNTTDSAEIASKRPRTE